jgi:hypothetical protein
MRKKDGAESGEGLVGGESSRKEEFPLALKQSVVVDLASRREVACYTAFSKRTKVSHIYMYIYEYHHHHHYYYFFYYCPLSSHGSISL